jgi:hypothetical protein
METGQKTTLKNNKVDHITNNELSIQVSLSGLSFCILDTAANSIIFFKDERFDRKLNPIEVLSKLKDTIGEEEPLNTTFDKVNLIFENELSTLVPRPLFNEENIADYLKYNSRILQTDYIAYDELETNESVNVYIPYVNINNFVFETYGVFVYKHFSTILIESILKADKNNTEIIMHVHRNEQQHFEIIVTHGSKLLMYNYYEGTTEEDFIYYILFTAEQLELNPETFSLSIFGNINKNDSFYKIAYKYVRNTEIAKTSIKYDIPKELEKAQNQFVLLNSF